MFLCYFVACVASAPVTIALNTGNILKTKVCNYIRIYLLIFFRIMIVRELYNGHIEPNENNWLLNLFQLFLFLL